MTFSSPLILAMLVACGSVCATHAAPAYAVPRFADPQRLEKMRPVFTDIDRTFTDFARERPTPGLVWAVVVDGAMVHSGSTGFAQLEKKIPAGLDTRFRIASMTKSFTAMAILKLRDAGKFALDDRVDRYIPELGKNVALTADAPALTIRHLLTMTGGFPQDDPWADQLLAQNAADFEAFLRGGVTASNSIGVSWEYSNFGYALLGHIVTRVAGESYQRYITREIFEPLGMKDTRWEYADVPGEKLALGYRRKDDAWSPEPLLHDGVYGSMGGLITTLPDFARYVSLHLAARPARNDADPGPVRRATLREMHKPAEVFSVFVDTKAGEPSAQASGYGYGLGWSRDNRGVVRVGHSGGLPGFGSNYVFLPDYGVAVISFANLTYAGTQGTNNKAIALLLERAELTPRVVPPSPILLERKQQVAELITSWSAPLATAILADNFFLDRSREEWMKRARETLGRAGKIVSVGDIVPENQLRGTFVIQGESGRVEVVFTLTPEKVPRVQALRMTFQPRPQ